MSNVKKNYNLNFSKIFGIFLFIFFLSILLFIFYKKYFFYKGIELSNMNIYLFICIMGIISSIIVFYLKPNYSKNFFLLFVSTLSTIYFLEYSLNYINIKDYNRISIAKKNNINYDTRTIFEVVNDLKSNNYSNVSFGFPTIGYISPEGINLGKKNIYPLSGISMSNTVVCNESGNWSIYLSDRYGFNNPDQMWDKKNIDAILLGDSYVHGDCVDPKNNIAGELISITDFDVLNLGFRGNSPITQFATFIEYGLEKKPKNIFWFFSEENDLEDIYRDKKKLILTKYIDTNFSQNLKMYQSETDKKLKNIHKKAIFYSNLKLQKLRLNFQTKIFDVFKENISDENLNYEPSEKSLLYYENIMKKLSELANKNNFKINLVYLPSHSRYIGLDYSNLTNEIEKICSNLKINFINIDKEVFLKKKNPLDLFPLKIRSHYTAEAYKDIARVLSEKM